MAQVLNSQAVVAYRELQTTRAAALLRNLLDRPEGFEHHILRFALIYLSRVNLHLFFCSQVRSSIVRLTYGFEASEDDDAVVSLFGETVDRLFGEGPPGVNTIDFFPFREFSVYHSVSGYVLMIFSQICSGVVSRCWFSETCQSHERLCTEHEEHAFRKGESRASELLPLRSNCNPRQHTDIFSRKRESLTFLLWEIFLMTMKQRVPSTLITKTT